MAADFSVVAIIAAYNEADVIEHVVSDLIDQGIHIYFLDDGSTDGTVAAVERHLGRGVLGIERLNQDAVPAPFDWERILLRKSQLASELDASWFIHHDADEFRESPWPHLSLIEAIRHVDALGYNAIDFAGLEFWPVDDRFRAGDDVRDAFTFYSELAPYDRVQIRCWKKTADRVDLASSGGHEVRFSGRKIFPGRFILRHYPIRGQAHGERKVFQERRTRFVTQERARGWHVQYDAIPNGASFIRKASTLTSYDPEAVRLSLTLNPRYPEELETALGAADAEITAVRAELVMRCRDLDARAHEIVAVRAEVAMRCRDLERRGHEVEHLNASLAREHEEVHVRDVQAARLSAELDRRVTELAATYAELNARHADIARFHAEVGRLNTANGQFQGEIAILQSANAGLQMELTRLNDVLQQRVGEVERGRTMVDELTRRLEEFQRSLSWRWTSPVRAVYRIFRRS
jgi:glycosyl transferase family 2